MTEPQAVTTDVLETWANDRKGPVALTMRQKLLPVEGEGAVIYPPTYATAEGYVIDRLSDGTRVAQIDSVGAQANRMEPLFKEAPHKDLVPQITITLGNEKTVSILDAGHRLGDALVRSTRDLAGKAQEAFAAFAERGDAAPIARLAPTSLVFGAWDSRGEGAKLPRLVNSVIRAWDVDPLHRAATYIPPVDYAEMEVFNDTTKKSDLDLLSSAGFRHAPSQGLGGIIARGGIFRDVTLNLVALRHLDGDNGAALRRYVLGLALVAATEPQDGFLRQGCLLTPDPDIPAQWTSVARSGERTPVALTADTAQREASDAAKAFGVGSGGEYTFDKKQARDVRNNARRTREKAE